MLSTFAQLKPYLTFKPKADVPKADNLVFRLHYKWTFVLLIGSCILVSLYPLIEKADVPILCIQDKGVGVPASVINHYCWIMSTFTLPKHFNGVPGQDFLHHGVGAHTDEDEVVYHAYYQWVPLMLAFQAICFYFPYWLWKILDAGRMKHIIAGLNNSLRDNEELRQKEIKQLAAYLRQRSKLTHEHQSWAMKFFICECLNFVNVILQIVLTDVFLGGEFTTYGTEVLNFPSMDPEDRVDPMSRIFPRMTKCIFHKYGGSGTIQRFDAMCVLGMNIINEKVYIFLWFWYILLGLITGANLILRGVQFCAPNVRDRFVTMEALGFLERGEKRNLLDEVLSKVNYSDWLILYYLAQCMNKTNFYDLIKYMKDNSQDDDDDRLDPEALDTLKSKAALNEYLPLNVFNKKA